MARSALLVAAILLSAALELPEEDNVLVLNDQNFDAAVKSTPMILVMFYAPWCGHCKQMLPEFAKAAAVLKEANPPVGLAKVDATVETRLAEEYGVRGYPTIKFFIKGRDQEYTGGRMEGNIVTWILRKSGPAAVEVEDVEKAQAFVRDHKLVALALVRPDDDLEAFTVAARQHEDVMFAYSKSQEVADHYSLSAPALRMFFTHDEKMADFPDFKAALLNSADIASFVKSHRHPFVIPFNVDAAPELFSDGRPLLILFRDTDSAGKAAEKEVVAAAPLLGRRVLVSVVGSDEPMEQRLLDYVSVDSEELPTVRLIQNPSGGMVKYKLQGDISATSVRNFLKDFESGLLRPHLKSEDEPPLQSGVYQLVGSTFEKVAKDPTKDVLVQFYAPWCGHCKKVEPVYREVAKKLERISTMVIAKMDATANDVEDLDVEGFPTIKFWRGNNKKEALEYDGDRDVDALVNWLEEKASFAFSQDELKQEL